MTNKEYQNYVDKMTPNSPLFKDLLLAFLFGGTICALGQILFNLCESLGYDKRVCGIVVTTTLILIATLLTSLGVFDKIARLAGAGTLVPVTGFSNAIASEAIDAKSEGYVLGVGAKIYTVAGPVILYGLLSGVIYGVIYYLWGLFGRMYL